LGNLKKGHSLSSVGSVSHSHRIIGTPPSRISLLISRIKAWIRTFWQTHFGITPSKQFSPLLKGYVPFYRENKHTVIDHLERMGLPFIKDLFEPGGEERSLLTALEMHKTGVVIIPLVSKKTKRVTALGVDLSGKRIEYWNPMVGPSLYNVKIPLQKEITGIELCRKIAKKLGWRDYSTVENGNLIVEDMHNSGVSLLVYAYARWKLNLSFSDVTRSNWQIPLSQAHVYFSNWSGLTPLEKGMRKKLIPEEVKQAENTITLEDVEEDFKNVIAEYVEVKERLRDTKDPVTQKALAARAVELEREAYELGLLSGRLQENSA